MENEARIIQLIVLIHLKEKFKSTIMEYKVEKFQMSPSTLPRNDTQERIYQSTDKPSEATSDNVALNFCPDGSEINISINGTTLNATKTSLNVTIGNFTININSLMKVDIPMPSIVAVISVTQRTPLHVVLGDSPDVKATLPLSKLNYVGDTHVHDVSLY